MKGADAKSTDQQNQDNLQHAISKTSNFPNITSPPYAYYNEDFALKGYHSQSNPYQEDLDGFAQHQRDVRPNKDKAEDFYATNKYYKPAKDDYATPWESYAHSNGNHDLNHSRKMSGGPPHHPHGRQGPAPNTAWNHLQVPNYFPRQPQHAHMSNEHSLLHQPTWHTPTTTEPVKSVSHSHLFNLEQMISERPYPRHSPGVDLSLQRNGSQNGELPAAPISLSVRDANKINSLSVGAIDMQAVELTKSLSPGLKSISPGLKVTSGMKPASPGLKPGPPASPGIKAPISPVLGISTSPGLLDRQDSPKNMKRPAKRMDSIIERLNPMDKTDKPLLSVIERLPENTPDTEKPQGSVIVQSAPTVGQDETSNSSVLTAPATVRDEDVTSPFSNDDSTDSNKSRRKRKPAKTIRVTKEVERIEVEPKRDDSKLLKEEERGGGRKQKERRRSGSAPPGSPTLPLRTRRKTSSESETIANIAAMVEKIAPNKTTEVNCLSASTQVSNPTIEESCSETDKQPESQSDVTKPISVSVIRTNENIDSPKEALPTTEPLLSVATPAQKKMTDTISFVEVENKLEEMFAGISDALEPSKIVQYDDSKMLDLDETKADDTLLKLDDSVASARQFNDSVSSTSNDQSLQKRGRPKGAGKMRQSSESEVSPKRKKASKKSKTSTEALSLTKSSKAAKKAKGKSKVEAIKDIYAYDSGSNASSSKSKGPYVQIRGPRDSPLSVSIVNTPTNDEDSERKSHKPRKYHDDVEYRHKVRTRGLHCSTLSNKYDAQTRDATWICAFCKRGPHATDPQLSGPSRFSSGLVIPLPPGDLFGPYVITTNCAEYERRLDDPYDKQFRSKKVARVVMSGTASTTIAKQAKKSKRKHDDRPSTDGEYSESYLGITETKDKVYEVWVHEDCLAWSPGVHLVGPRIVGLEEAVWTTCNVACARCKCKGANVCCVRRGCLKAMHFVCAVASGWSLDENSYKALCAEHRRAA